jgi:hypothetical protein
MSVKVFKVNLIGLYDLKSIKLYSTVSCIVQDSPIILSVESKGEPSGKIF